MKFTDEQILFIQKLGHRNYMHLCDGGRCDFCGSDCNCDETYLDGLVNDYINKFHTTDSLWKVREMIEDY